MQVRSHLIHHGRDEGTVQIDHRTVQSTRIRIHIRIHINIRIHIRIHVVFRTVTGAAVFAVWCVWWYADGADGGKGGQELCVCGQSRCIDPIGHTDVPHRHHLHTDTITDTSMDIIMDTVMDTTAESPVGEEYFGRV